MQHSIKSTPTAAPDHSVSMSTLIDGEHGSRLDDAAADVCKEILMPMPETDDEYIEGLLSEESRYKSKARCLMIVDSFRLARSNAVRWTLKKKTMFGFSLKTVYMALSYFDQFFMHRTVDIVEGKAWAVQLLSVACLTLAAKMEEHTVPALSEFQVEEVRFSSEAIQRMELFVLSALGWRLSTTTPFAYLSYLASKYCENGQKDLISKATKFIFAVIEVINLVDYQPSVVAIAAVLAASDERLTWKALQSKISILPSCRPFDMDNVFSCYNLMVRELHKESLNPEKNVVNRSMSNDANGTNSYVMTSGKRRRLQ